MELPHGRGSLVTPMTLIHSVYFAKQVGEQAPKPFMFPPDAHLETHFMFDIHIYICHCIA